MGKEIANLEPKKLWNNFYNLTQIPRPSKKEERIIAFVEKFGKDIGLETIVDEIGNVIIRKPATKGFENRKGIILQGHLDMVPQKNSDTVHDFEADPIKTYIDGEWITAKGTTLGADNGIGVAAAMAILESNELKHGPIEALFTIDEETGMTGASELKPNFLKGDILLNLDSEDEGELYIGCAGGIDTSAIFNFTDENPESNHKAYKIFVKGLKGGHSGLDISLKRGNANLILNNIIKKGYEKFSLSLAEINGGSLRNAIPREAFAMVSIPKEKDLSFIKLVKEIKSNYLNILTDDQGLNIALEEIEMPNKFINKITLRNLFNSIENCPNGVIKMDDNMEDVIETSSNLAIVKSENNQIKVLSLQRSSSKESKNQLCIELKELFERNNAVVIQDGEYPGWMPNPDSAILKTMKSVYNENFGKIPEVKVIHAGLECGILGATYPNWDMISFGPTIRYPHSPDEKVNIKSVDMFWKYLVKTLENAPNS